MAGDPKGGKGGGGKKLEADIDDWAAALDEWDANLDNLNSDSKPKIEATPEIKEALKEPPKPVIKEAPKPEARQVLAKLAVRPAATPPKPATAKTPAPDEPPPLDAAPLPAPLEDDPLMHLFDGDMELPEEAGEALGSLLGDQPAAQAAQAKASGPSAQATPAPPPIEEERVLVVEGTGETRVADQGELAGLLDVDVDMDLGVDAPPAPRAPVSLHEVADILDEGERAHAPAPRAAAHDEDDEDLEVEIETGPAEAASEPEPTPAPKALVPELDDSLPPDEEFYDDISVEAGRDEPSVKGRPQKTAPPPDEPILEQPLPDVFANVSTTRASDPDRTPLPLAEDGSLEPEPTAAPAPAEVPETRTVVGARLVPASQPWKLDVPERVDAAAPSPDYLRGQLALLDTERLLCADAPRAALLAYGGARLAERLGDVAGAQERYEAATELDPTFGPALRGIRKLRLVEGKPDVAANLVDREIERAGKAERPGLISLRAELALASGDREQARRLFKKLLEELPGDVGAALGLCDVAVAEGRDDDLAENLTRVSEGLAVTDGRSRGALAVERGRLDEAAGRARDAVVRYREALANDPAAAGAAWGLLRIAVRTAGGEDDLDTHARLDALLPAGPVQRAVERRLGVLRARAGDAAGARRALTAAATENDPLALADLVDLERNEGRLEEASLAIDRLISVEKDPPRRADLLFQLGDLSDRRGVTGGAMAAYARAMAEYPDDPRAARALERAQSEGGDKQSKLERHLTAAERDKSRAPYEWTLAARLCAELGRPEDALARLGDALGRDAAFAPAVELAVELHLSAKRPDEAAGVLLAAADARAEAEEPARAAALRERAARLLWKAGRLQEALAAVRPLVADARDEDALPLRWLEQHLLNDAPDIHDARSQLADSVRVEAETLEAHDKGRASLLWHWRGLLVGDNDPEEAAECQRRSLVLDAGQRAASAELTARLRKTGPASDLPGVYQSRLADAKGRPEAVAVAMRLGAAFELDANDLAAAARAYHQAAQAAPGYGPAMEAIDRVARRAADDTALIEALERELAAETLPEGRFALLINLGERLEHAGQPERAVEKYRAALELRPDHPVAVEALERTWKAARNFSALADRALSALKDTTDKKKKVHAYEKLAWVDGELRGDPDSALMAYESLVELDPAHHVAMRVLEKRYLSQQRWPELVALYEHMGLTASDPAFASATHLDRARLRRRLEGPELSAVEIEAAIDNDHRLALQREPHHRTALRYSLARARLAGDLNQFAELSARLADSVGEDGRTAAICLTRAGEALVELERGDDAKARFVAALGKAGLHLPALVGLGHLSLGRADWKSAIEAMEEEGQALRDPAGRADAYLVAGAIAQDHLNDLPRALGDLRQSLSVDARRRETFTRLERVLVTLDDPGALSRLYAERLQVETDGARLIDLHLKQAQLYRDRLGDRDRARSELRSVLSQDAAHNVALQMLGDLHYEDQQWAEAADALIRRARVEKTRPGLKDIFYKLGLIYSQHTPDPKRAIASFQRVLKADPDDVSALEHLSNIFLKEWDWRGALETTQRLADLETDKPKKVQHLHRVAKVYEEGFKDARHALEALRIALDLDPMYLPSIGELAKFFDRQSDVQSMRVHLDRTAARVRQLLDRDPFDANAFKALVKIFTWRRAPDRASMAAGVLDWLGAADADEKAVLGKLTGRDGYPGSALADPTLDDALFDSRIPGGFRHLFRLLDESLGKVYRGDIKRLGLSRGDKLPNKGHAVRDLANRIAADLGVREFDLYVTAAMPNALLIEVTEPVSIVLGSKLVEGAHETECRFFLGRALKMTQAHMVLPMRLSAEDLGVLVAALVRQFVPDFKARNIDEKRVAAEGARIAKIIPKKMQSELLPFALECASETLDLLALAPALVESANRAGLITTGVVGPALSALKRLGDDAQLRALLRYCVSDEFGELRRAAGTSIG
jgi:tetratricopeptide (TPR) repeat protein